MGFLFYPRESSSRFSFCFFSLSDLKQMRFSQEAERPPKEAVLWLGTPFWSRSPGLLFVFSLLTWGAAAFLLALATLLKKLKRKRSQKALEGEILTFYRDICTGCPGIHC